MTKAAQKLHNAREVDIGGITMVVNDSCQRSGIEVTKEENDTIAKYLGDLGYGKGDVADIFVDRVSIAGLRPGFSTDLNAKSFAGES